MLGLRFSFLEMKVVVMVEFGYKDYFISFDVIVIVLGVDMLYK